VFWEKNQKPGSGGFFNSKKLKNWNQRFCDSIFFFPSNWNWKFCESIFFHKTEIGDSFISKIHENH
jgi:hypothetical protein